MEQIDEPDEKSGALGGTPTTPETSAPKRPKRPRKQARQWGALAHLSVSTALLVPFIGGWAGPLAIRLTKGKESEFVDDNALEALNFGILLSGAQAVIGVITGAIAGGTQVGGVVGGLGSLTKLLTLIPLGLTIVALVLPGMAAMKANQGKPGRYPEALPRLITKDDDDDDEEEEE